MHICRLNMCLIVTFLLVSQIAVAGDQPPPPWERPSTPAPALVEKKPASNLPWDTGQKLSDQEKARPQFTNDMFPVTDLTIAPEGPGRDRPIYGTITNNRGADQEKIRMQVRFFSAEKKHIGGTNFTVKNLKNGESTRFETSISMRFNTWETFDVVLDR
jgi:hypothetical protein